MIFDIILKVFSLIVYLAYLAPVLFVIVLSIFIIRTRDWEQDNDEL